MMLVIGDGLRLSAKHYPDKIAVSFQGKAVTYSQLNFRVNRLANGLLDFMGLRRGDRVAVLLYNCAEYAEIMYALAKAGLVVVPVNFRFVGREIEYIVNNSGSRALIFGEEFKDVIDPLRKKFEFIGSKNYLLIQKEAVDKTRKKSWCRDYRSFLAGASANEPDVNVDENNLFYIGYTSGTTGFPKGAARTHYSDTMAVLTMLAELGFSENDKSLLVMPLFHCNSIWFSLVTLAAGGTIYIYPSGSFSASEILRIIDKEKITFTSLVPTMCNLILSLPEQEINNYDVKSIRALLCSSAPLSTKTKEGIIALLGENKLYEGYGATESGLVTLLRPKDQLRKIRCIGKPIKWVDVKLFDGTGNPISSSHEVGEVYIKSEALLSEYYQNHEATVSGFCPCGDFFSVGDMAKKDEEGYFYLVDRKNDVINSAGEKIFPTEVEEIILGHPAVYEVAVVGTPDEKWGERVTAVVVLRNGADVIAQDIIDFCRGKLAGYKIPKSIDFVSDLPKTPTGKILRRLVRAKYWQAADS